MTIEKPQAERRKHSRKAFNQTPWLFTLLLQNSPMNDRPLRLEAKNIGMGGIKFHANYKFPLFQNIQIQFLDKTSRHDPIVVTAQIIRVEETDTGLSEKTYGLAAKFTEVPRENALFELALK
jgi:hypothetical protein